MPLVGIFSAIKALIDLHRYLKELKKEKELKEALKPQEKDRDRSA